MKKANNLSAEKKYSEAIKVLKRLLRENPGNFQVLFNLGDVLRVSNNQPDAIKYYNKAINSIFYESENIGRYTMRWLFLMIKTMNGAKPKKVLKKL